MHQKPFYSDIDRLRERLASVPSAPVAWEFVSAKEQILTAKVFSSISDQRQEQWLHSRYNPEKEAASLCRAHYREDIHCFVCVGFGLGYHIAALRDQCTDAQRILIIEPCPGLFAEVLARCSYEALLQDERVDYIVDDSTVRLRERIKSYMNSLVPYEQQTITLEYIPFYERWETFVGFTRETVSFCAETFAGMYEMRNTVIAHLNELRTTGLGKTRLGDYKSCLAFMRKEIEAGQPFAQKEVGILAAYYLASHYAYSEVFAKGEAGNGNT